MDGTGIVMSNEKGNATERFGIKVGTGIRETGRHETQFKVEKWDIEQIRWTRARDYDGLRLIPRGIEPVAHDFRRQRCNPFEEYVKEDCNLITDLGWTYIMNGFAGAAVVKFVNATSGRIGLGTSATAVAYGDTALGNIGALTTANWKVINAVPTVGNHTTGLVLAAQFATTEANGVAIQEFGTDTHTAATLAAAAAGTAGLITHGNATPGTKTAAQTWNTTVTVTWT